MQLYNEGIETNKRVVAMLMQRAGLVSLYSRKRRWKGKHRTKENLLKENLLQRKFDCETPGRIFVTDISYVDCRDGTIYLTSYLDLATRIPKDYGITNHMRKECLTEPLERLAVNGAEEGAIIHSDQGSQYRSCAFANICEEYHFKHSMSLPGNPIDNVVAEAFFKSVKTEVVYPNRHRTKDEMEVILRNYMEDYYPKERIHTKLKMTPLEYKKTLLNGPVT